ncbi:MAG: magnesium and cobalt transport protein CorA [Kineosporiaceae bacterium]
MANSSPDPSTSDALARRMSRRATALRKRWVDERVRQAAAMVGQGQGRGWVEVEDPGEAEAPGRAAAAKAKGAIVDCAVYTAAGRLPDEQCDHREGLDAVRAAARTHGGFTWISLLHPTAAEFAAVTEAFGLHALAAEDAVRAHQRPKLETYDDQLFAVLKPVHYVDHEDVVDVSEVAVFLGPDFVVTVKHGPTTVVASARDALARAPETVRGHGPVAALYLIADAVVDEYEEAVARFSDDVDDVEGLVFGGDRHDHAQRIYTLKRELIEFRRAVAPLVTPMQHLAEGQVPCVGQDASPYFRDIHDHVLRSAEALDGFDKLLSDVLSADLAQVSVRQNDTAVRQNEDMRKISAWAAIALVPTAVAGIYGMNFQNMPELSWHYGYFYALAVIATLCAGLYWRFRRNGWL